MDFYTVLCDMFPNKSSAVIHNIIKIVEEANPQDPSEYKVESMINLLAEIGGTVAANQLELYQTSSLNNLLDEAAGYNVSSTGESTFSEYEGTTMSATETLKRLIDMLPNADPSYLEKKATELANDECALEEFITNAVENNKYPTLENYLKNQEEKREKEMYITNFHVRDFLKQFPDPHGHFSDPSRKHSLSESNDSSHDEEYALTFLYNHYLYLRTSDIAKLFRNCDHNLVKTSNKLKRLPKAYKEPRHLKVQDDIPNSIPLLQEIAFIQNETILKDLLKLREENYQNAKECGLLETCGCCYFEELIPEECYFCKKGCIFCKDCVKRGTETSIGQQKYDIACFTNGCDSEFSLSTLQMVLDAVTFKGLFKNKQLDEINKANLEGLEYCPLCGIFAVIPNPGDKIFHCQVCNKDSCRECKHISHTPLRCNEVEYDEDVKIRTFIENKMAEALIRKCKNCNKVFIKSSGCNKIACCCGTTMCYLCGAKIKDYSHFSQSTCPLFTDDNAVHKENVLQGANAAKAELGVDVRPGMLKFDPTKDIPVHYN